MSTLRDMDVEPAPRRPLFTVASLANYLAISERTVRALIAAGDLPSYKLGGVRRIDPAEVDEWMTRGRRATVQTPGG